MRFREGEWVYLGSLEIQGTDDPMEELARTAMERWMTRKEAEAKIVTYLHERGSLFERAGEPEALLNYKTPTVRTMILVLEALGLIRFEEPATKESGDDQG